MKVIRLLVPVALALSFSIGSIDEWVHSSPGISIQAQQSGQQPGPPGAIRVRVRVIPVDVVVADKDGKPILDLKKEDFTVLENGEPQSIQFFSFQKIDSAPAPPRGAPPQAPTSQAVVISPQTGRTFLILMGRGRHQRNFRCVDALIQFVRNDLLPQDKIAVFAYNRATEFTADHERVALVLERYKRMHERIEPWFENQFKGLAAIYGSKEVPASWQSQINKIFDIPDGLAFRQIPPGRVTAEGQIARESALIAQTVLKDEANRGVREGARSPLAGGLAGGGNIGSTNIESAELKLLTDLPFDEYAASAAGTNQDVQNIFTAIEYLRYMDGEKHLMFFTENGLFLPRVQYDKDIANVASDARVAFDAFQTGGIYLSSSSHSDTDTGYDKIGNSIWDSQTGAVSVHSPGRSVADGSSQYFALTSLRQVSELTGGRAAIHKDIGTALTQVDKATRTEYLLGYYPKDGNWDGKYHEISVKVNRPGTRLSYRHGYFARDILEPYDRREFVAYSRIAAAAAYASEVRDIAFKVSLSRRKDAAGRPVVGIDLKIDSSKVGFRTANNVHSARVQIVIFAAGPQDKNLGSDWQTLDMDLREETYRKALQEGIPYSTSIPASYNLEALKIVVYDFGSDRIGSTVKHLL
jgi:VWFA-related protein